MRRRARTADAVRPTAPRSSIVGRRYHFHVPGLAYAATTAVLVLGAINGQNNLLFWVFGLAVAGLIVSGVLSGASLMGLVVEREPDAAGTVGDAMTVRYRVRNRNRFFPAFGLTIEELPLKKPEGWQERLPRPTAFALYVPARGVAVVEASVVPHRRGVAEFERCRVSTTFPFGLTKKSVTFRQPESVRVRPFAARLRAGVLDPAAGRGEEGTVLRRNRTGDEFYALRDYREGDSVRSVAWRTTARLGRAVVRDMASRPSRRVWIVMDVVGADAGAAERAISGAAGLARAAIAAGLEPGLATTDGRALEPARGSRQQFELVSDCLALLDVDRLAAGQVSGRPLGDVQRHQDAFVLLIAGSGPGTAFSPEALHLRVDDIVIDAAPPARAAVPEDAGLRGLWDMLGDAVRDWRRAGTGGAA